MLSAIQDLVTFCVKSLHPFELEQVGFTTSMDSPAVTQKVNTTD